jgi:hypothetical protein
VYLEKVRNRAANVVAGTELQNYLGMLSTAFVYLVEGDVSFGNKAKALFMADINAGVWNQEEFSAFTYDWIHPLLSASEKSQAIAVALQAMNAFTFSAGHQRAPYYNLESNEAIPLGYTGLAVYGDGTSAQNTQALNYINECDDRFRGLGLFAYPGGTASYLGGVLPCRQYYFPDGGYYKNVHYGSKDLDGLILYLEVFRIAGLGDHWSEFQGYLNGIPEYFVRAMRPDGLSMRLGGVGSYFEPDVRGLQGLTAIASRLRNGLAQYMVTLKWSGIPTYQGAVFVLHYDPTVAQQTPSSSLPLHKFYGDIGDGHSPGITWDERVIVRSGWNIGSGSTDSYFHFQCGDYFGDDLEFMASAFEIFHRGALAIRSGSYESNDSHRENYYFHTVCSNAVTVRNPAISDALARFCQDDLYDSPGRPSDIYDVADGSAYDTGDVTDFATDAAGLSAGTYYYMKGVVNPNSAYYVTHKVNEQIREIVVIGNAYVILDRVTAAQASFEKSWMLHTIEEPSVSGTVTSTEVAGHIIRYAGDTATVDRSGVMRLHVKRILPADGLFRKVGGAGYECWVDGNSPASGTNYPIPNAAQYDNSYEGGRWRLETRPGALRQSDVFLHVLQTTPVATAALTVSSVPTTDGYGVSVGDRVVVFPGTPGAGAPMQYEVQGALDDGLDHILALPPGSYEVSINGQVAEYTRDPGDDLIRFRTGPRATVSVRPAAPALAAWDRP